MLKATLRSAVLLGISWALATPSFAEVQNVRVGGDVTVRGFARKNLDMNDGNGTLDGQSFFMQTTGINVGADLTENIAAFVRLANERDWNLDAAAGGTADVSLSQAYVTLKELFYAPLTVRIGSQPIVWGRGFVLGSSLIPGTLGRGGDRNASITPNEYTDFTAFDAVRATLDLSNVANLPLSIDYVYIKLNENSPSLSDDVNLQGVNLSSHFEAMKSELEAYYLNKFDHSVLRLSGPNGAGTVTPATDNDGSVNTLGLRGSMKPIDGAHIFGEMGYQFGKRAADAAGQLIAGDAQQAWAFDLGLEYTFAQVPTTPMLGWEWIFWSGHDVDGARAGWDPIARGYFTTALREFQTASSITGFYPNAQTTTTSAATNQHEISWYGSLKPLSDLTIAPRLSFFWLDKGSIPVAGSKRRGYAGAEWDTNITYNYTEDVQFGVLYALFSPGNIYRTPNDNTAQELVTTVGVKF